MERAATLLSRTFVWDLNQWSPAGLLPLTHNTNNTNNNHPDPISSPLPQTRGHFRNQLHTSNKHEGSDNKSSKIHQ